LVVRTTTYRWLFFASVVTIAAGGTVWWQWLRPRVITVCVFTDAAYRHREGWSAALDARFREVSKIYEGTVGIRWSVKERLAEPTDRPQDGIDARRLRILEQTSCTADLVLVLTGRAEGGRAASVNPFSHAALVVQPPEQTDAKNTVVLARDLGHLFGAPQSLEPGTLMADIPEKAEFDDRTAKLIMRLRGYDFAVGVDGLQGTWKETVLKALEERMAGGASDPTARAHHIIATSLATDGRIDSAIPEFRAAIDAAPGYTDARYGLAVALVSKEELDAAITELRGAIDIENGDARLHGLLGVLLAGRGDRDAAVDELTKALSEQPDNALLYGTLGSTLAMQTGRIDAAIAAFREAARLQPGNSSAKKNLAEAVALKERLNEEAAWQRRVAEKHPGDTEAQYNAGVAAERAGDFQAAGDAFQNAIRLDPVHGQAHANLATVLYLRQDYAGAWQEVQKAAAAGVVVSPGLIANLKSKAPK
jgi:Flp pilus assembly protein TadD